jgi:hypothetical protein
MPTPALEYARKLYENHLKWYADAETRAQAALTLDGVLLAVLTGVLIAKSEDVSKVISVFEWHTWLALIVTAVGLLVSIGAAVLTLQARPLTKAKVTQRMAGVDKDEPDTYNTKVMWYFQLISELKENHFVTKSASVGEPFEQEALARQVFVLAGRLTKKFRRLFWSFTGTAVALIGLLGFAASYVLSVRSSS